MLEGSTQLFFKSAFLFITCNIYLFQVFYLPSESGKKITFSTYLLVSQTLFFLLLTDIIPATSVALPLIGKYLLFTMLMVTLSVFLTVFTQNIHYRVPTTHCMSEWVRTVFIDTLPNWLKIRTEIPEPQHEFCVLSSTTLFHAVSVIVCEMTFQRYRFAV